MKYAILFLSLLSILSCKSDEIEESNLDNYYPPLTGNSWQTQTPNDLQWNETQLQSLFDFLEEKHTKGFIILKDGKIVIEKYFNGHSQSAKWNWYSAAKTLTGMTVGIAQQEGFLNINDKTSDYLGVHWTSLNVEKENLITIKDQLSMTSGLDDINFTSTNPTDLTYLADAGTRWAYHNGPYTLLQEVISQATSQNFKSYFSNKIEDKIGMNGTWFNFGDLHIYRSTTRDMARFGHLILKNGKWNDNQIINNSYFNEMTTVSQSINNSYGYLWWLNGKSSFMLPTTQEVFNGSMIPNAPNDMIMALGANDQKIYVIPSKNMVVIRVGDTAGDSNFSLSSFDNNLWGKISQISN
jgi:CubicO group peptidase (beta-lactamase class C family)